MDKSAADLIFEEWKAALSSKDRSSAQVPANFDELFGSLKESSIPFDEAHTILPKAIKAHLPPVPLAKKMYKTSKQYSKSTSELSEAEWIARWNTDIANKATNSFFGIYSNPNKIAEIPLATLLPGSMSVEEYKAQRRYADQFPRLNTRALEEKMLSGNYDPSEDLKQFLDEKKDNGNIE